MSTPAVTVHVNRGSEDTLETAVSAFETAEPFDIALRGHEAPAHVHCRLTGDLARIATLDQPNYYVEPEKVTAVPIDVDAGAITQPVEGTVEVLAEYGSESVAIPVTVEPGPPGVDVDESLAEPAPSPPESTTTTLLDRLETESGVQPATIAVLMLGLVAIAIATMTAATIGGTIAAVGLGVVVLGFVAALGLLLW